MGANASFLTQSCTQLSQQLTQKNLLSLDYQKISQQRSTQERQQIEIYQHFQTKKLYKLQKFQCDRKDSHLLSKALKKLQFIKNTHICNVLYTEVNTKLANIISKYSQAKVFSQHSGVNFLQFIEKKVKQNLFSHSKMSNNSISENIPFKNVEIAHFIHSLAGISSQILTLCLPVKIVAPEDFLMFQNQQGKMKFSLNFDHLLNKNNNFSTKGYFSPQLFKEKEMKQNYLSLNQNIWKEKYEKNLIFGLGMVILHYLLMENCQDCYNYKSDQFCQSQLQNKLHKVSLLLESRLVGKDQSAQIFKQSRASLSSSGRISTNMTSVFQQEPFQVILYELLMEMLCPQPQKRIAVKQLKFRSRKLMQKVHQQVMLKSKSQNSQMNFDIFQKAKKQKAIFTQPDFTIKNQPFQQKSLILVKKTLSNNQTNTTDSVLPQSRGKSVIKHLKSKRKSDQEKSFLMNSSLSFLINKENHETQNIKNGIQDAKNGFRKLSGYRKVKLTEHTFLEGLFQDDKAHGLGKITRKNGEIIECIFHNNEMIDPIEPLILTELQQI